MGEKRKTHLSLNFFFVSMLDIHYTPYKTSLENNLKRPSARIKMFNPEEWLFFMSLVWQKCLEFSQLFWSIK